MARPNIYAGPCSVCGDAVEANKGFAEPPPAGARSSKWVVKCTKCAGVVVDLKPRIQVTQTGTSVAFKPATFLGGDLFGAYRSATSGSRFDGASRSNVASMTQAIPMVKALFESGFNVELPPSLAALLQSKAAEVRQGVADANSRASRIDEELQKRGLALFPYQRTGVQWLASRSSGALLADDMGLGKTIQILIAIAEGAPVLVVGPAVAKNVWKDEAAKWRPDLKVSVLSGRGSFRWPAPGELVITNYEILPNDFEGAPQDCIIVADEAHVLKSFKALRTKRFRGLSESVRALGGKVWLATATPLMNRPGELWSILQAAGLANEAFGSWSNFTKLYGAYQDDMGGWVWGDPSPEVAECLKKVMLRREKVDVLPELPSKMYREIAVDLDEKTKKLCAKAASLVETYTRFSRINDEQRPSEVLAAELNAEQAKFKAKFGDLAPQMEDAEKLLSRIGGVDFEVISKARQALAMAKIPTLMALVESYEEQEEPVVVFSAHLAPINLFKEREGWGVITGETKPEERKQIQDDFQAGKLRGVAATIKAGGVALTLTRACNVIFVDLEWSPSLNEQAEDRILRIGQLRAVLVTTLVAAFPLDQRIHEILTFKRKIIRGTISASKTTTPDITLPDLQDDFLSTLTKAADEERKREEEAQKGAEERKREFAGRQQEIEEKIENERKEQRRRERFQRWDREASESSEPRRLAQSDVETWAVSSLQMLASLDPDRAFFKNDAGFSASDGGIGHRMAYLASRTGLTENEWKLALGLCRKYRRQVGEAPKGEE